MILEHLAAAGGGEFEQYTMVAGTAPDLTGNEIGYSNGGLGSITPTTYRNKLFVTLKTTDYAPYTVTFQLGETNLGANYFSRIEFIQNGALIRTLFSQEFSYIALSIWTAQVSGFTLTAGETYTIRIYY